jgi:N4-(beta-N-acetylglucosaminyl)-L-asparaginase
METSTIIVFVVGVFYVLFLTVVSVFIPQSSVVEPNNQNNKTLNDDKIIYYSKLNWPIVVNTWPFTNATERAWKELIRFDNALEAVVSGCEQCEMDQCDGTVGFGGSPDETSETTLDAMIMDGLTHDVGSVAGLRQIKNAIRVAHAVMKYTKHTLIVGDSATTFAVENGFTKTDLHTDASIANWWKWRENKCQPNFRINVTPDPTGSCGPYKPIGGDSINLKTKRFNENVSAKSHDTIGMIAIDSKGNIAGGTSTNGASHKIPG